MRLLFDERYHSPYGADLSNVSTSISVLALHLERRCEIHPFRSVIGSSFDQVALTNCITVASGDPFDTSVILWKRAEPVSLGSHNALPDRSIPACVSFSVFRNEQLDGSPVASGEVFTSYDVDWTVKVEASGLEPDTKYFF
ncbi:hypothetical protein PM082_012915 [Marasmius tenuissimus]|nr:hypothetical protein PM082_012915 [Marasmius tenuissimus]